MWFKWSGKLGEESLFLNLCNATYNYLMYPLSFWFILFQL